MAVPQHQFIQQQHQQQLPNPFGSFFSVDRQVSPPVAYLSSPNLIDQSQHQPYVPPFHVVGFAPVPAPAADAGVDFQQNCGLEPKRKRLKEQDFFENNSQISSVDFLQARSVSTGLGLSLNNNRFASSGDSPILSHVGDEIDLELQRQDAEIDRFLKVQGDRLRQDVLEKLQASQLQAISCIEEKFLHKLHEKEAELENSNRKKMELEFRMEQLVLELGDWQQRAKHSEDMISALKFNLQQIYAQSRDSKEGCGDSEVDDTASCCKGHGVDFRLLSKEPMVCKVCRKNQACMVLLPCKHLCVCKGCESELSTCPLCQSLKSMGFEVYM